MNPLARVVGLTLLCSLPVLAQSLKGTLDGIPIAPVPVDQFGNPIPVPRRSAAEIEADRLAQKERADRVKADEDRLAAENQRRAEERRNAESLAEERQARNRNQTIIYVVVAVAGTLIVSRLLKKRS